MTIHIPNELESSIQAAVDNGHFATLDDAMTEAARMLLADLKNRESASYATPDPALGSIGAMSDADDELDAIVADAYRKRNEETWRDVDL